MNNKKSPGRPRIHEIQDRIAIQFRVPCDLRENLLKVLEQRNETLPYKLSLNSFLLELVQEAISKYE